MAEIKQDVFTLKYSQNFEIEGVQEANIDLALPNAPTTSATVYGTVTDGSAPIPNATVNFLTAPVCLTATHSQTATVLFS